MKECLAVRDRLSEYAFSTLDPRERAEVEQHLSWCAGCRKEAAELRGGAALVGFSLPLADPPPDLEDRVVTVVRAAAAKAPPTRRRGRRWVRTTTVLAAVVGLLALTGGLIARQQSVDRNAALSRQQAAAIAARLQQVLNGFQGAQTSKPHTVSRAILAPTGGAAGGGGALRIVSPHFESLAIVIVGALPQHAAPYHAWLVTTSGRRLPVGRIAVDSSGGGTVLKESPKDLRLFRYVEVRDSRGRLVLSGSFDS